MSGEDSNFTVWGFIKGFGKLLIGILLLLQGLIGLVVLIMFATLFASALSSLSPSGQASLSVPDGAALVLNPKGVLVEQTQAVDPFEQALQEAYGLNQPSQISMHDVARTIRRAKEDDRIKSLVLDLGGLAVSPSSSSKLHYLTDEIDSFKESGKKVFAIGDSYSQSQYLLAAHADEIYMNDYGNITLLGYGRYGMYLKSFLEKFKITSHVFRVGTFKSAVEPYLRDDMSPEAKEANVAYLSVLWREYVEGAEKARGLEQGTIENYANNFGDILRGVNGDMSQAALEAGLVDGLKTRAEMQKFLKDKIGADDEDKSFKQVSFYSFLASIDKKKDGDNPNVAIVTAAGVIVDGEAPVGVAAGGDTVARFLKRAREDEDVKAVVLRVDSPGGSAFASSIIRDEVLALKKAGKPVVVSMGSLAASGGYWIAADADEIWASPTTITGSIGIFGYFTTFENTVAEIGVSTDGVGTTSLSPLLATGIGPLPEAGADVIQQSVENGYDRFLSIVGKGRNLDKEYVDSIAQGRVWIGEKALELKLVDHLGDFEDAIAAAAKLADLEEYDTVEMIEKVTTWERIFGNMSSRAMKVFGVEEHVARSRQQGLRRLVSEANQTLKLIEQFNDPNALYVRCMACDTK